ncbi:MAG: DNA mismatch repair protein MutS [Firmicutes bacterium]|nr:DNA mismatch repair protein MutS [Bacillota bacterium]
MKRGSNRRLSNIKTRTETGFDFVASKLDIICPLGKKAQKDAKVFYPGEEELLEEELGKVEALKALAEKDSSRVEKIREILHCLKDVTSSIERAENDTLTVIEIYEIKSLLLYMESLGKVLGEGNSNIPEEFIVRDASEALNLLDPKKDRINTFYIYDDYSSELANLRARKKELDGEIRKLQKIERDRIKETHGIILTPKFDIVIPKSSDKVELAKSIKELEQIAEDYSSITFALAMIEGIEELAKEREDLNLRIEEEEFRVRKELSGEIGKHKELLLDNCDRIGRLDYVLAKAIFAKNENCVRPIITRDHLIHIEGGRQLQVEWILKSKGKEYMPITMELNQGVTCITGANMGGKTISLKLAGLIPIMTQYGYFVPCEKAAIGLSNFVQILIGDSQSVERGLSSFGSEMEELKEILDHADDRSLILVDEIASGTNPVEGLALTRSIIDYLVDKPYITLLTTHYETVTNSEKICNIQVRGLAEADFRKLNSELSRANRRERIEIIGKYMDYSLIPVETGKEVPKDALNIARMLGLPAEIIDRASEYIK